MDSRSIKQILGTCEDATANGDYGERERERINGNWQRLDSTGVANNLHVRNSKKTSSIISNDDPQ